MRNRLTPEQDRRLASASVIAKLAANRTFEWWLDARTGNSWRGQWLSETNRSTGILDAPTIDGLFDIAFAPYEGAQAREYLQRFEDGNTPLILLLNYCKKNMPGFEPNLTVLYVYRSIEFEYTTKNNGLTVEVRLQSGPGPDPLLKLAIYSRHQKNDNHTLQNYKAHGEVAEMVDGIVQYAKKVGFDIGRLDEP